jgi:diguanylate cyclase (GGDEF)-like protein/PAS domain S-box-containing protein
MPRKHLKSVADKRRSPDIVGTRRPLRAATKVLRADGKPAAWSTSHVHGNDLDGARATALAAREEARAAHARLREALEMLPQGIVVLDKEGRYILWNEQYAKIYHRSSDLFKVGARLADTLRIGVMRGDYPAAKGREEEWLADRLAKLKRPADRHEQWLADGRCILIEERRTSEGGIIGLRVDITELKEREASFRLLFEGNPVPMFIFDRTTRAILSANEAALKHYGYTADEIRKKSLFHIHDKRDHGELDELYGVKDDTLAGRTWTHLKSDGSKIDVAIYSRDVVHERTPAVLSAAVDITERKRAEAQVAYMADHDALTGLANRARFNTHTEELLTTVRRGQKMIATLCIGLDNFKSVNDTLGHSAGDLLLKCVAQRISEMLRHGDLAARVGGDEFAVVLANVNGPSDVSAIAQRINAAISASYNIMGSRVVIGSSIGVAVAPGDGDDAKTLLKNANIALAQVKEESKGTFRYFEPAMNARVQARCRIENELRTALDMEELEVHYQPLVALENSSIVGAEALVRWRDPKGGYYSPAEFIPVAEDAGLIVQLGSYVLRRACADAMAWPDHMRVAVNLSPLQFQSGNIFQTISEALTRSGLPPQRLEVEITETLFLDKSEVLTSTLNALRALGVRIAMDDFGTGYSSLGYLCRFPFDKIKIDRSFVQSMNMHAEQQAIVKAIVTLGAVLGKTITAEGIETKAELECLKAMGCDQGQGFLFSKARPQAELLKMLDAPQMLRVA